MLALLVASIIAIVATTAFYMQVQKKHLAEMPKTNKVLASATALQAGTPLTPDKVVLIDWPQNLPLEGALHGTDEVAGRVLMYPVGAKEPILTRNLAGLNSGVGLTAKIPDGMRATAVRTNEVSNVAGFIFPGSKVDVLVTYHGEGNAVFTRTLLQNMPVLSVGTETQPDPSGKPTASVGVITMLTTPEESQLLVLAQSQGTIQFVLRNGGDTASLQTPPASQSQVAGTPSAAAVPAANRKPSVAKKPPQTYTVVTISGDKTTVVKF